MPYLTALYGFVIGIDLVAYSRLPMRKQLDTVNAMERVVCDVLSTANYNPPSIGLLPTGDGLYLCVVWEKSENVDVEAAYNLATSLEARLKAEKSLQRKVWRKGEEVIDYRFRIAMSSGVLLRRKFFEISTCRELQYVFGPLRTENVVGDSINLCNRLLFVGPHGQLVVSEGVARRYNVTTHRPLRLIGLAPVKHGQIIAVYGPFESGAALSNKNLLEDYSEESKHIDTPKMNDPKLWRLSGFRELKAEVDDLIARASVQFKTDGICLTIRVEIEQNPVVAWTGGHRNLLARDHPASAALTVFLRGREHNVKLKEIETRARFSAGGGIPILLANDKPWILIICRGPEAPNYPLHLTCATGLSEPNRELPHDDAIRDWIEPRRIVFSEVAEEILIVDKKNNKWLRPAFSNHKEIGSPWLGSINTPMYAKARQKSQHWLASRKALIKLPPNDDEHVAELETYHYPLGDDQLYIKWGDYENKFKSLLVVDAEEAAIDIIGAVLLKTASPIEDLSVLFGDSKGDKPIDNYVLAFSPEDFAKLYRPEAVPVASHVYKSGKNLCAMRYSSGIKITPNPRLTPVLFVGGWALVRDYGKRLRTIMEKHDVNRGELSEAIFKGLLPIPNAERQNVEIDGELLADR